ncbi:MAG: type II toxin-antitoxin system RelE/ParE family toxin [Hyphomonadaceae bacterium]|jgi:hypothetical protein|nr:type II toxin-antitoxin system RelE/ParE family toxin [Hyphomonadaceae bacterium]
MRVFLTKDFARFARKERIKPDVLHEAIDRARRGLIDADLGGGLIKQRVARPGQGRSRSYRTIIAYRAGARGFFMYGFAKSERDNVNDRELTIIKRAAQVLMRMTDDEIETALAAKELAEI